MNTQYVLSSNPTHTGETNLSFDSFFFEHDLNEKFITHSSNENNEVLIIGDFVDSLNASLTPSDITANLLESDDVWTLIKKVNTLAGRYLIFTAIKKKMYIIPDPICSIPVNYYSDRSEVVFSASATTIADLFDLEVSKISRDIKASAEQQQPLPNNLTMYDEIKTLIPNHFFDISKNKPVRLFPIAEQEPFSMDDAVAETIRVTKEIIQGFKQRKKLSIPLTSGVDSRTVLALMKEYKSELVTYTYFHENFSKETADIKIPLELTNHLDIEYHILERKTLPDELYRDIQKEFSGLENRRILENAYTYKNSELSEYSAVPGDIISISKSPFGKNLPESFANLSYFMTKTHNYSSYTKQFIQEWMEEAKPYSQSYGISLFDLFNLEYRLGRWLPNNIQNYDKFVNQTYIFNCRYLVEMWMRIPKSERTERSLHLEIIEKEWPELLEFEFNPDEKIIDKVFENPYSFYIGSFAKYHINRVRRLRNK